eukprot:CAMPEP_0197729714 /NCGR_PEP_ID=MMETSP1434-20131217/31648_1 /TAXON_ID=265543 /ORGANISM="Minutocellus polymorphus, Strain CCMP3303" /LENGTH=37 /DNA_ID= /DNA_START= /DNA_END= /DNA_ORIENTATION=
MNNIGYVEALGLVPSDCLDNVVVACGMFCGNAISHLL